MTGKKVNRLIVPNVYTANGIEPVTSVNNILPVNGNVTIPIPTVPTNVSAFTNDAGYLTSVPSQYITDTELSITLADYVTSANLTTILDDYATKQWVTNQGYTTNAGTVTSVNNIQPSANGNVTLIIPDTSNLANKDLSNLSSAGKSKFQVPLVSGTNIKTINNQSLLGSGNIDIQGGGAVDQTFNGTSENAQSGVAISNAKFIQNTATGSNSITILGTAAGRTRATNIGYGSTASEYYSTALGCDASASGYYATALGGYTEASGNQAVALGFHATASGTAAIQIGYGTNSTANTLNIGFYENNTNWQLLDGKTGLIPDARISSNIARTSDIPDVSNFVTNSSLATTLSSYATQAWVGQQGYITDVINALGFTPADRQLENITSMGSLISGEFDNVYTALDAKANTDLSNLSTTGQAVIDGKADTTLSNVSSIDSGSAVATALDAKVNNDDYYYKSGDTETDLVFWGGGLLTGSGKQIVFSIPLPKSLKNITTITCTALITGFRKSNGGYMPSSGGNGWNAKANGTVGISKLSDNLLAVSVTYASYGGTNNTPVGVYASISLSFT